MSLVGDVIVPVDKSIFLTVNKRLKKKPGARYYFLPYFRAGKLTKSGRSPVLKNINGSGAKREASGLGQLPCR